MATLQDLRARIEQLMELINRQNQQIEENNLIIDSLRAKIGL